MSRVSQRAFPAWETNIETALTPHRISIVTPSFNQGESLEECIDSVYEGTRHEIYKLSDDSATVIDALLHRLAPQAKNEPEAESDEAMVAGNGMPASIYDALVAHRDALVAQRDAILSSVSWHLTAPLRFIGKLFVRRGRG